MRKYTNPAIKISRFMTENIITTSGTNTTSFEDRMAEDTKVSNITTVGLDKFDFTVGL